MARLLTPEPLFENGPKNVAIHAVRKVEWQCLRGSSGLSKKIQQNESVAKEVRVVRAAEILTVSALWSFDTSKFDP